MINQIMADKKAQAIYISLDTHIHPETLADNYLQAKLSGNTSECLALECFIRELAIGHFHRPEVLDALSAMERHKKRRKLGKGGTKDLKDIARRIRKDYARGAFRITGDLIEFYIDGLKVRCKDKPGAVELVACKYERGLPKRGVGGRASYGPPCNWHHKG